MRIHLTKTGQTDPDLRFRPVSKAERDALRAYDQEQRKKSVFTALLPVFDDDGWPMPHNKDPLFPKFDPTLLDSVDDDDDEESRQAAARHRAAALQREYTLCEYWGLFTQIMDDRLKPAFGECVRYHDTIPLAKIAEQFSHGKQCVKCHCPCDWLNVPESTPRPYNDQNLASVCCCTLPRSILCRGPGLDRLCAGCYFSRDDMVINDPWTLRQIKEGKLDSQGRRK
jgi:hypothetical protein